jgi:hypothetical protein
MRPIPLNFLTMYADLAQGFDFTETAAGSVSTRKFRGKSYLYVTTKHGASRIQHSLGPADDPRVQEEAKRIAEAAARARNMRTVVSTLKQKARIPAPTLPVGRVLQAVSNVGLFKRGITLVGTAAYQTYPCIIGSYLPTAAFTTNDIDLSVVEFEAGDNEEDIEVVLRRANPTFKPQWHPEDKLPKVFMAADGLKVEMLTRLGRGGKAVVEVDELGCSAVALSFQEYPAEETIETVALYGPGVLVRVPTPLRFAVHKLIVAQRRKTADKKQKDLRQARELIDIFLETDENGLQETLDEARDRGRSWKTTINASLKEIGREARQGELPFPVESGR